MKPARALAARVLLPLVLFGASTAAGEPTPQFHSWLMQPIGMTHRVWGVGLVDDEGLDTAVRCGSQRVPVRAVYEEAHQQMGKPPKAAPPTAAQSHGAALAHNRAILGRFAEQGIRCEPQLDPSLHARRLPDDASQALALVNAAYEAHGDEYFSFAGLALRLPYCAEIGRPIHRGLTLAEAAELDAALEAGGGSIVSDARNPHICDIDGVGG
jgi:hypothetical protein